MPRAKTFSRSSTFEKSRTSEELLRDCWGTRNYPSLSFPVCSAIQFVRNASISVRVAKLIRSDVWGSSRTNRQSIGSSAHRPGRSHNPKMKNVYRRDGVLAWCDICACIHVGSCYTPLGSMQLTCITFSIALRVPLYISIIYRSFIGAGDCGELRNLSSGWPASQA